MWWTKFIQKLFLVSEGEKKKPTKTIKDLDFLDTVWVKEDGIIFEGFVFDITRRCIIIVYGKDLRDFRFRMEKPLNRVELEQSGKVLYCNEPEESYVSLKK